MKLKKLGAVLVAGALAATLGLVGCSSGGGSDEPAADEGYTTVQEGAITFLSSPDYPPFENLVNDEYVGFEIDLVNEICARLGVECVISPLQFDGIIPAIVAGGQGDVGLSGFSVTPERAEEIDFTTAYYTDDMAVVVLSESGITEDTVDEALNSGDIIIACQSGTTGEEFAKENYPEATTMGYGSANDTFAALQSGKAQAICTNLSVAADMLTAYPEATIVKRIATGEDYAMVVSKDNPGLTAAINEVLAEMEADGTLDDLRTTWGLA